MGVSAAVGSATVAALTGSAWAGPPDGTVPAQRAPSVETHRCGHADTMAVSTRAPSDGGSTEGLTLQAVDGAADPVDAAFDRTTLRVRIPGQRSGSPGVGLDGATGSGAPAAEVTVVLPTGRRPRSYDLRATATFDDGITRCTWSTEVAVPPGR
jgi:hypothetical protein